VKYTANSLNRTLATAAIIIDQTSSNVRQSKRPPLQTFKPAPAHRRLSGLQAEAGYAR